jgi:hypothetical protein
VRADRIKRKDRDQLGPANVSQSDNPSERRRRGEDEEPSRPRKKIKREELSGPKSTTTPAVKKSESEPETPKPGNVIGALIGKKRRLKKARRGGG